MDDLRNRLQKEHIVTSAPCRIDMGGTLDIPLFNYYLKDLLPRTFNIAVDMRTFVSILPHKPGKIKISSKGFNSEEFSLNKTPFDHPLGLMFAIVSYFKVDGIHIKIDSKSPPKSALGGSSTAAVALIYALLIAKGLKLTKDDIVMLAYNIESIVAKVPCGIQDQLAATYGGINAWRFPGFPNVRFMKEPLIFVDKYKKINNNILLAYCGIPHESKDVNSKWVDQFMRGRTREMWHEIVLLTNTFIHKFKEENWSEAALAMNKEVEIRRELTPEVFDETGILLVEEAINNNCGARFTGAGGGGCIWAIGESQHIAELKDSWSKIIENVEDARLLEFNVAENGIIENKT